MFVGVFLISSVLSSVKSVKAKTSLGWPFGFYLTLFTSQATQHEQQDMKCWRG